MRLSQARYKNKSSTGSLKIIRGDRKIKELYVGMSIDSSSKFWVSELEKRWTVIEDGTITIAAPGGVNSKEKGKELEAIHGPYNDPNCASLCSQYFVAKAAYPDHPLYCSSFHN